LEEEQTNSHKFRPLTIACSAIVIVIEWNRRRHHFISFHSIPIHFISFVSHRSRGGQSKSWAYAIKLYF